MQPGSAPACRGWTKSPAARSAAPYFAARAPSTHQGSQRPPPGPAGKSGKSWRHDVTAAVARASLGSRCSAGGSRIHGQHHRHTLFEPNDLSRVYDLKAVRIDCAFQHGDFDRFLRNHVAQFNVDDGLTEMRLIGRGIDLDT